MQANKKKYVFAARSSLLSVTQTQSILQLLREKYSDKADFELKILETKGDKVLDKPLWKIDGKDFFTQELDSLLIHNEVDACVHSYKDLATKRPAEIQLAAITPRLFPQDILLVKKNLRSTNTLHLGTSSPRRIFQLKTHLPKLMPASWGIQEIQCHTLRGNVPTRIKKLLHPPQESEQVLDGIVLAFAGLERLSRLNDPEFDSLFEELDFMILPPGQFTPAPGQGALAVEVSTKVDPFLWNILQEIHDEETAACVQEEKKIFSQYGQGCHLPMGIYVHQDPKKRWKVYFEQGEIAQKTRLEGNPSFHFQENVQAWKNTPLCFLGMGKYKNPKKEILSDELIAKIPLPISIERNVPLVITSKYVLDSLEKHQSSEFTYIASGIKTWEQAAKRNYWIHYSLDSLGNIDSQLKELFESSFYKKRRGTHQEYINLSALGVANSLPCYERKVQNDSLQGQWAKRIQECHFFYWASYFQYETYSRYFPHIQGPNIHHACGIGKTYEQFEENLKKNNQKIQLTPFVDFFKQILSQS